MEFLKCLILKVQSMSVLMLSGWDISARGFNETIKQGY